MSKRTLLWLIPLVLAFLTALGADKYFQSELARAAVPADDAKIVSAAEFLAAVKEGRVADGKVGFYTNGSGLADLAGRVTSAAANAEQTSSSVDWRTTARLTETDIASLRHAQFAEGDTTLTARVQRARPMLELGGKIAHGATPLFGWVLLVAALILTAQYVSTKTGGFANKAFQPVSSDVKFKAVAGCNEAKEEVSEIVEFLKNPQRFEATGGRMPKGVLLVGPPGTGKTLLAKAVAGEANAKFYSLSGSDFVEMYVGVGAARIRSLFKKARENAPSIIFIDELDAVGRQRSGSSNTSGQQEHEHTLNALLVEMDGFARDSAVVVFGATNRPEIIDKALLRPGRFDRQVTVGLPDVKGREEILRVHAAKVKLDESVSLSDVARATPGFAGADLANLVNEGALHAARKNRGTVLLSDLEEARDKISWGRENRRVMTDADKRLIAIHEAGHALMQVLSGDDSMRLHKVTIIPRGQSLGSTQFTPERDILNFSKEQVLGRIRCLMGGRVAEEIALGSITSGASGDIQEASRLARQMVFEWGMSEFGFLALTKSSGEVLSSSESLHEAEANVRALIDEQYRRTTMEVSKNRGALEAIAAELIAHETITGDDVRRIVSETSAA